MRIGKIELRSVKKADGSWRSGSRYRIGEGGKKKEKRYWFLRISWVAVKVIRRRLREF